MRVARGLVEVWKKAIKAAMKDKEPFSKTADICTQFYTGSTDAMWSSNGMRSKYFKSLPSPKFQITIAKGFELASIVGPSLVWRNPQRQISGYNTLDIPPEIFPVLQGIAPDDPMGQQIAMQFMQEQQQEQMIAQAQRGLMEAVLNYTVREQPGGGLKTESQLATYDALIKGRGCVRTDAYTPPDSDRTLVGSFYFDVNDLFVDPECTRANWTNAKWIAIRHVEPHWKVEKRFGWAKDSLKGKAGAISKTGASMGQKEPRDQLFHKDGTVNDLVVWFEIFSKCGVGTRFQGAGSQEWHDAFEQSVGDYAYLCVAEGVNEFLNFKDSAFEQATLDEVAMALDWPIPFYKDDRWPVAPLDFWHNTGSAWPLATLGMGLGELIFLNVFISSLCDRVYRDGLTKMAVMQELCEDATSKLLSLEHEVLEMNGNVGKNINELVSYLQRPNLNFDVFRMLDQVSNMFDKRVGLTEMMYGFHAGGKVSRTAADANIRGEAVSVRPEHMAQQVEDWQTEIANLERIAAGYSIKGSSIEPLVGRHAAQLWDALITESDPEVYMRQMRSRVEANSMRRPNKAKDNQNIQSMAGYMLPMLQWYAGQTGNTDPLNAYIQTMGKAMDQDMESVAMPPITPPEPSPEEVAAQEEAMEMQRREQAAKIEKLEKGNAMTAHKMLEEGVGQPAEVLTQIEPDEDFLI